MHLNCDKIFRVAPPDDRTLIFATLEKFAFASSIFLVLAAICGVYKVVAARISFREVTSADCVAASKAASSASVFFSYSASRASYALFPSVRSAWIVLFTC